MVESIERVFRIPELRAKILFTIGMLVLCRLGGFIPVPGINGDMAVQYFRHAIGGGQNLFQMVDIFAGGAFSQMTVVALGVMPYISASIIMNLLVVLMPGLQREIRENSEAGKRKLSRWTRIGTLVLAMFQSAFYARFALQMNMSYPGIIVSRMLESEIFGIPWMFFFVVTFAMTTGTLLLMWVGEQITEKGIGNGVSLIICVGIFSQFPTALGTIVSQLNLGSQEPGNLSLYSLVLLAGVFVFVVVGTILIIQGQRRIPLQYARRVVGRKETQGGSAYLPLKLNYAGVIPVIFASAFLMMPATIGQFIGQGSWIGSIASAISPGSAIYVLAFVALIVFFTYFWTSTQFHPEQIASDMKRNGAFIPGVRQGKPTQEFLESTMNRITLIGAGSLALIAISPTIIARALGVSQNIAYFFGGTSLLIMVGVILDTMKQIESHLLMKRYDGFMKKGRIRGR